MLIGMADELTSYVAGRMQCPDAPMVLKCIPYGSLEDVSDEWPTIKK
jgi:hypothetical protein